MPTRVQFTRAYEYQANIPWCRWREVVGPHHQRRNWADDVWPDIKYPPSRRDTVLDTVGRVLSTLQGLKQHARLLLRFFKLVQVCYVLRLKTGCHCAQTLEALWVVSADLSFKEVT